MGRLRESSGAIVLRDRLAEDIFMSVRVAACQIDPEIGQVDRNLERIERSVIEAAHAGAELAVFPEAAVTGYAFSSLDEAEPVASSVITPGVISCGIRTGNCCEPRLLQS